MSHKSERELVEKTHNTARYFTETRHVAWVVLAATVILGIFAYIRMPKRKDPFIKGRVAVAVCAWPGAAPEKVEELITRRLEEQIAQNAEVEKIESTSRTGVSMVSVTLRDSLPIDSIGKTFDDIDLKLRSIRDLPQGATPIDFQKDFGDTAALLLTVASPRARPVEITLRARAVSDGLRAVRLEWPSPRDHDRSAIVVGFPTSLDPEPVRRVVRAFATYAQASGRVQDLRSFEGPGFLALDARVQGTWTDLSGAFLRDQQNSLFHPEIWSPVVVSTPAEVEGALRDGAGAAYSYRELDDFTERIARQLRGLPLVAKVTRAGVLAERVYLNYSQERFAAVGVNQQTLRDAIAARNVQAAGGVLEATGRTVAIDPSGEYRSEKDIGDTLLTMSATGTPTYVRDLVEIARDYESPPLYSTSLTWRDSAGHFQRTRAISLAIQMRAGEQIGVFAEQVDAALKDVFQTLPDDLVVARTSDQAQQVEEKVDLFMTSLYEAIAIIVVVGFVGFREWRSALLVALSIPLTLAMTFTFMWILGIDVQQMSIAALILALGLLVDDPVVAGDAIKHELDSGQPRRIAAWLGPTKLARAIVFATVTNIVAYLPFLLMRGDVGNFIYSLPIVLTCSLVASRLVSMTFIPLLGYTFLRRRKTPAPDVSRGFLGGYRRLIAWAIQRRLRVLACSLVVLVLGGVAATRLRSSFFPKDYSHIFYIDVFLPEDSSIRATTQAASRADEIVQGAAEAFAAKEHHGDKAKEVIHSITTYVGGGAPRFWYSLAPQQRQPNYAQLVVEVPDEHDTAKLIAPVQEALTSQLAGARVDVRQLENGKPVPRPVEVRFSGDDAVTLRMLAARAKDILAKVPIAERIRDDWGENSFRLTIDVDPARAALAGVSNVDVASASAAGFNGVPLNTLREGDKQIPIVGRLRFEERGSAGDLQDLYVLASGGAQKVPLSQVARVSYKYAIEKIQRMNQRRTISVSCFPASGMLPSEVMKAARKDLDAIRPTLPPGYAMEIGGMEENVLKVRKDSAVVAVVSLAAILLTLVVQFRNAIKPLIVLAAIPYGISGALLAIVAMGAPFGFTAILGVISLVGVIVSHIIVLFDYIEESRERGEDLHRALLDAGTVRLRPVLITVGATVLGLVPLALHGGPLWEPLCYAQIGGLTLATLITLVLVPMLYAVFVIDLKWVKWSLVDHDVWRGDTLVMPKAPAPVGTPQVPISPPRGDPRYPAGGFAGGTTQVMVRPEVPTTATPPPLKPALPEFSDETVVDQTSLPARYDSERTRIRPRNGPGDGSPGK